jgi:hypothetical protein
VCVGVGARTCGASALIPQHAVADRDLADDSQQQESMKPNIIIIALVALLSSTATAGAAHLITGNQIAPGTITSRNIKDGSLTAKDFRAGDLPRGKDGTNGVNGANGLSGSNGRDGAQGATGANGDKGDTGATGATGASGPAGPAGSGGTVVDTGAIADRDLNAGETVTLVASVPIKARCENLPDNGYQYNQRALTVYADVSNREYVLAGTQSFSQNIGGTPTVFSPNIVGTLSPLTWLPDSTLVTARVSMRIDSNESGCHLTNAQYWHWT